MTLAPNRPTADKALKFAGLAGLAPQSPILPGRGLPRTLGEMRPVPVPPRPLPAAGGQRWTLRQPATGITETARENRLKLTPGRQREP